MRYSTLSHTLLVVVAATASEELQATVHKLQATVVDLLKRDELRAVAMTELLAEQQELRAQLAELKETQPLPPPPQKQQARAESQTTMAVRVDASGVRRLSATAFHHTTVGTTAWQTHVFPENHNCPNLDNSLAKVLLPITNQSQVTWNPVPTNLASAANVSLRSVAADWSTTEIQQFPAPFTLVHDADCTHNPTLSLPLATEVQGVDVGAALTRLGLGLPCAAKHMATVTSCSASTEYHANYECGRAHDGTVADWAMLGQAAGGSSAVGQWIQLDFDAATTINKMKYRNRNNYVTSKKVRLDFSDGSSVDVDNLQDQAGDLGGWGLATVHEFPFVTTTFVKITVLEVYYLGDNGALEIEFFTYSGPACVNRVF